MPIEKSSSKNNKSNSRHVIANITYTDSDIFAGLTIGYASKNVNPIILFYGNLDNQIAKISNAYAEKSITEVKKREKEENLTKNSIKSDSSLDGECQHKGISIIYAGSEIVGTLNVFHPNELRNQGITEVFTKVNTVSSNARDYVKNDLGYGSKTTAVYPDEFKISICGNHDDLHAVPNTYIPENSSTNATIDIPFYLGPKLGVGSLPIDITMSSTSVSTSRYSSDSRYQNKVSWDIYKRRGWNPDEFDGDYSTKSGISVSSTYTYSGTVRYNLSRTMSSTGSIRYEYWVMLSGNLIYFNFTTDTASITSDLTIRP